MVAVGFVCSLEEMLAQDGLFNIYLFNSKVKASDREKK